MHRLVVVPIVASDGLAERPVIPGSGPRAEWQASRMATFTEILALLVEHGVPLDEALNISATASGDARLARGGQQLAEQVRAGNITAAIPPGIPPLVGWLILGHAQQTRMADTLRRRLPPTVAGSLTGASTWVSICRSFFRL